MQKSKKTVRAIIAAIAIFLFILAGVCIYGYNMAYSPNFDNKNTVYVYIDKDTGFGELCKVLSDSAQCKSLASFKRIASLMKYPENIKTGCYAVKPGSSNISLIRKLRNGQQDAIRLTFNNIRTKQELMETLDEKLMLRADELEAFLNDSVWCDSLGFNTETISTMFIPNTYEVYWNTSAKKFLDRMKKEYDRFWNDSRKAKAKEICLTQVEVAILASIVEEETAAYDEYPIVAGLYINRLKKNIPLQADPTVKFAWGDFSLQRILFSHLEIDSPYNTYKHTGLPPGPLRIPSIKGLDAVLNYQKHQYLYMCAKEDLSGRHNFAKTLAEHSRNAKKYQTELNRRKIR